jgi:hypothetical protein
MVEPFSQLPTGLSLWPLKSKLMATQILAFTNKERLEVSKGLDLFDFFISLEPISLLFSSQFF